MSLSLRYLLSRLLVITFCGLNPSLQASDTFEALTVRAMLEPVREAVISSELSASISSITVNNGDRFHRGQALINFNCAIYQARLKEFRAEVGAAKVQLANKQDLLKLRSVGSMEVELAQFNLERMEARAHSAKVMTERCAIRAPFNGRVVEVTVNNHESVEPGTKLVWLLDDSSLEVNLVLPSSWLGWLKAGHEFRLTVDENGQEYKGSIARIGSRVDAVSQSVRVTGILENRHSELIAGMSGSAVFSRQAADD